MENNNRMGQTPRLHSLDFLKFLSAIIIVFHHFQQVTNTKFENMDFYFGRIPFGNLVEFFFIISGFVTALSLCNKQINCFKTWILGKIIRIYPMAMLSVLVTFFIFILYYRLIGQAPAVLGLWHLFTSLTCTFCGGAINIELGINNPLWYVCVLFICYVFTYCILWISKRLKITPFYGFVVMCVIGIGAFYYKINLPFLNYGVSRGYAAFFFGMILYYIYNNFSKKILFIFSIILTPIVLFCLLFNKGIDDMWGILTFILFPAVLFLSLSVERIFKSKFFSFLGGVSFEVYIWHSPMIFLYICIKKLLGFELVYSRLEMLLFAGCVCVISCFIYTFIEKTMTKQIKNYLNKSQGSTENENN